MLNGKKTYILAIIGIIFNGAVAMGYADEGLRPTINSLLGFFGLGTLRQGVKSGK